MKQPRVEVTSCSRRSLVCQVYRGLSGSRSRPRRSDSHWLRPQVWKRPVGGGRDTQAWTFSRDQVHSLVEWCCVEEEPVLMKSGHTSHPGRSRSPPARSGHASPAGACHKKCWKVFQPRSGNGMLSYIARMPLLYVNPYERAVTRPHQVQCSEVFHVNEGWGSYIFPVNIFATYFAVWGYQVYFDVVASDYMSTC